MLVFTLYDAWLLLCSVPVKIMVRKRDEDKDVCTKRVTFVKNQIYRNKMKGMQRQDCSCLGIQHPPLFKCLGFYKSSLSGALLVLWDRRGVGVHGS